MGRSIKDRRDFEILTGKEVIVESNDRPLVALDGERQRMKGPVKLTRRETALKVILPPEPGAQGA